jgi:hypothetical protein
MPPAAPQIPPKTRKRLAWKHWLGIAAALLLILLITSWFLMRATPSWYTPMDPTSLATIDLATRAQENKLHHGVELHNALENVMNGEQPWTLDQDEINALIAINSRDNLPVTSPMVIFTPGKITLAARSKKIPSSDPAGGVGSIVFTVKTFPAADSSSKPRIQIRVNSAWLGRLPVPKSLVESRIPSLTPMVVKAVQREIALHQGSK